MYMHTYCISFLEGQKRRGGEGARGTGIQTGHPHTDLVARQQLLLSGNSKQAKTVKTTDKLTLPHPFCNTRLKYRAA